MKGEHVDEDVMEHRKQPVSPEVALASDVFDKLCSANTLKTILGFHRHLCDLLHLKPGPFPQFYLKLKVRKSFPSSVDRLRALPV